MSRLNGHKDEEVLKAFVRGDYREVSILTGCTIPFARRYLKQLRYRLAHELGVNPHWFGHQGHQRKQEFKVRLREYLYGHDLN